MEHLRAYLVDEVRLWSVTIVKNNAPVCEHSLCSYLTDWLLYFVFAPTGRIHRILILISRHFLSYYSRFCLSPLFSSSIEIRKIFSRRFHLNFNKTLSQFLLFQVRERPTIQISNQRKIYVPINIMTQLRARSYLRVPIKFVRNFIPLPSKGASKGRYTHTHIHANTHFFFLPSQAGLRYLLRRGLLEKNGIVREPGNPVLRCWCKLINETR